MHIGFTLYNNPIELSSAEFMNIRFKIYKNKKRENQNEISKFECLIKQSLYRGVYYLHTQFISIQSYTESYSLGFKSYFACRRISLVENFVIHIHTYHNMKHNRPIRCWKRKKPTKSVYALCVSLASDWTGK